MKYSILVLGASISISLFIRICCAVKVNSLKNNDHSLLDAIDIDQAYSRRSEDVYKRLLKSSILGDDLKESWVDHTFDKWLDEISKVEMRNNKLQDKSAIRSRKFLYDIEPSYFNSQYCGEHNPPNITEPDCTTDSEHRLCPDEELPVGCEYNEIEQSILCHNDQITDVPKLPPLSLKIFDLNDTRIKRLHAHAIRNVSISNMRVFRNTITDIHPWAFHDIEKLKTLMIVDNDITYLAYQIYVGLNDTVLLDLSYNRISFEIYKTCPIQEEDDIKSVLPNLRSLTLRGNPLKVIPMQMFAGLRESPLTLLYLDNCYIQEIHPDAFSYLKTLEILNLSGNPPILMSSLKDFIGPLTNLKSLYLSGNGLTGVPYSDLDHIAHQLQVLDLSGNIFERLSYDDLSSFPELEELYLDDARIYTIDDNAFQANVKLRALSLRNNKIRQFRAYLPETIWHFNISNGVSALNDASIDIRRLENLLELKTLDISNIGLHVITSETFTGTPELDKLFLSNTNLSKIEEGAFKNLKRLKTLSLTKNPISALDFRVFAGMSRLNILNLAHCSLKLPANLSTISGNLENGSTTAFPFLPNLKTLDLSGNSIEQLTPELFQNLPNLTYLTLSNNPIKSWDIRVFPKRSVFGETPGTSFQAFHLAQGSIQFINEAMLEDFQSMGVIDLSSNTVVCDQNACKLCDLITNSSTKQIWINKETYDCFDTVTNSNHLILNLNDDICQGRKLEEEQEPEQVIVTSGHSMIIIIAAALSAITGTTVLTILAYRSRLHLRYFIFYVKFNVMPVPQRKAKISTMEETEGNSYEFDVFISYHHEDSKFIEDVFLPEIELSELCAENDTIPNVESLNEAKNSIYFIDSDKNQITCANHNNNCNNNSKINFLRDKAKSNENVKRFKVCLHQRDFAAGVPITENIVDCTDRSRKTVIFVSQKYMQSQWCSFELNLTYHRLVEKRRNAFLLVLMEEIPKEMRSKVLNYLMVSKSWLMWPGWSASYEEKAVFWKRLRSFLEDHR